MAKEQLDYQDRIRTDPEIMAGKPVVRGTRIPVERVLVHRSVQMIHAPGAGLA